MPDTAIALSMEAAGKCARYDAAAKRILSFKAVIAWILKKACSEFRDYDVAYIMENCIGGVSVSDKAVTRATKTVLATTKINQKRVQE